MKDLTHGSETRLILFFTLPMLLGNVFQQLYNFVDGIVVGRAINKEALAAVGTSFPILMLLVSGVLGLSTGFTVLIAQFFGAKNYKKLKATIDTSIIFLLFMAAAVTISGLLFSKPILLLMKTPEEIMPGALVFLNITFGGMFFLFGYNFIGAILRGLGDSKTPLYLLIISTILNVILVTLFVLVFKWGIAGSAFGTVIAQGFSFIMGVIYINKTHKIIKLDIFNMKFDFPIFFQSLKIGLPSAAQQILVALSFTALMRIVNGFGTDSTAAFTACIRLEAFSIIPALNFSMALSAFTGQNIGAKKMERIKKGYRSALLLSSLFALGASLIVIFFGSYLITIFSADKNIIAIGTQYLKITGMFYIAFSILVTTNGLLIGAGNTIIPMIATLLSQWAIRIPLASFLSPKLGTNGIWWAIPAGWILGMIFVLVFYFLGGWRKKRAVLPPITQEFAEEESISPL